MEKNRKTRKNLIRVGVDFGTANTIVVLADNGNYPVLTLPFNYGGETLLTDHAPSCVTLFNGKLYHGPAAVKCRLDHAGDGAVLVRSLKRELYDWYEGKTLLSHGVDLPVETVLTGFLSEIRRAVLRALDVKRAEIEAVIAVPANASSSQRYITLHCFREAGFKVIRILDEPCASGIQFVRERYKKWDRVSADVVIYDLGGGTFDCTFLTIRGERFDPIFSRGISRLGGDDFDEALLKLFEQKNGLAFAPASRPEMLEQAREIKESLTPYTKNLHAETPSGVVSIPVQEFQEALEPFLSKTLELVRDILNFAGQRNLQPERFILVGGSTLLPFVPRKMRTIFGKSKVHIGLYPLSSVAMGAARQAEEASLTVTDRLQNHFGVIRVREDHSDYVDIIFSKGQVLPQPGQTLKAFRGPYDPRYNIGRFRYLECDAVDRNTGQSIGEPLYWNEILFPFDRNLNPDGFLAVELRPEDIYSTDDLRGEAIVEEYSLDEYGIVTVRIARTVQDCYGSSYNLFRR